MGRKASEVSAQYRLTSSVLPDWLSRERLERSNPRPGRHAGPALVPGTPQGIPLVLPLPISAFGWRTPPTWVARTSGPAGRAPHQHGDPFRVSGHRCDLPWMSPLGRMLGPRRQLGTALRAACRPNRSEPSRVPAGVGSPILRIRSRPPKRGGRLPHSPTGCQARPWALPQAPGPLPAGSGPDSPTRVGLPGDSAYTQAPLRYATGA